MVITITSAGQTAYIRQRWYAYEHTAAGIARLERMYAIGTTHQVSDDYGQDILAAGGPRKLEKWWTVEELPLPP